MDNGSASAINHEDPEVIGPSSHRKELRSPAQECFGLGQHLRGLLRMIGITDPSSSFEKGYCFAQPPTITKRYSSIDVSERAIGAQRHGLLAISQCIFISLQFVVDVCATRVGVG